MKSKRIIKSIFVGLISVIIAIIMMFSIQKLNPDWSSWRQATCLPNCFNETIHDGYLRQPFNTFSSFGYLFVGVYVLALPKLKSNKQKFHKIMKLIFGLSLVITGLGSAFYHMSLTFVGQTTDVAGMYLIAVLIILYALFRDKNISISQFVGYYLGANLILLIPLILSPELRRNLFAGLIIIGLLLDYFRDKKDKKLLLASASVLAFGFIFWLLDSLKLFFNPNSWLQGHVIWHYCGALACLILYKYYQNGTKNLKEK